VTLRRRRPEGALHGRASPGTIFRYAAFDNQAAVAEESVTNETTGAAEPFMIRKLKSGEYRLYSRKRNPNAGRRRNLGTFKTRAAAEKHERAVQYFKRGG
jgi:hypothetical protein